MHNNNKSYASLFSTEIVVFKLWNAQELHETAISTPAHNISPIFLLRLQNTHVEKSRIFLLVTYFRFYSHTFYSVCGMP